MKDDTRVNHPPEIRLPAGNTPLVAPIYQSVKFTAEPMEALPALLQQGGYVYSRVRNPTVRQLELLLAEMQGRGDAIAVGSGVAAVSGCLLALLKAGDHVVLFQESYRPTRQLCRGLLGRFGVSHSLLSITDHEAIAREVAARRPRVILFESPTNPCLNVADIGFLCGLAQEHGALTVLDNTFAGFHNHGGYPIDVYVHSLTKYAGGHGDVMGGILIANEERIRAMHEDLVTLGPTLDPHAAFLILRGMKTYPLRYRRQCESALRVAAWLEVHPRAAEVRHPGLASHPRHELACRQMADFGTLIAFDLRGPKGEESAAPEQDVAHLVNRLRLFRFAGSLGSTESLIMPCHGLFGGDLTPEQATAVGLRPSTLRLSIGLEDPEDLIADLAQALAP
jgi:cystathionine beta-lyase/cystathionine gamma-synthase